ncbi:MAG: autotransporter assembly complex protein TamA [Thermodesulfobacteriota bacterium]
MKGRIHRRSDPRAGLSAGTASLLCALLLFVFLTPKAAALEVAYSPRIEGAPDKRVEQLLKDVADTFSLRESPPAGLEMLRVRARGDASRMVEVLRSEGYYQAGVVPTLETDSAPVEVRFQVDAGPVYKIETVDLEFAGETSPLQDPLLAGKDKGLLEKGVPARAADIVDAGDRLISLLKNHGYPFAKADRPRALVDHARNSVSVEISLDPGPKALFGPVLVFGLENVEEPFVLTKSAWKEGEPYNASKLDKTRERLIHTGLFAAVDVRPAESLDPQGRIPIQVEIRERKHRTVGLGLSYRTDEGPGLQGSWKHRNLFGRGERLFFDTNISEDRIVGGSVFRKPEFLRPDQTLIAEAGVGTESPEAFTSRYSKTAVGLERRISDRLVAGGGVGLKVSRVDHLGLEEDFGLISFPLRLDWDSSDDLLDPTEGLRLGLKLTPYAEVLERDLYFVRVYAGLTYYLRLLKDPGLVLATRWAVGSITGASLLDIPADERFYAGGGGSVRGIPFQTAGALEGSIPVGGRSLLEMSCELRLRLTPSFGLAGFVDGGRAFEGTRPGTGGGMLWGAGMGVRYFSFLGPLRLDVAVPLDRREGVDDALQFYLSIGQAF